MSSTNENEQLPTAPTVRTEETVAAIVIDEDTLDEDDDDEMEEGFVGSDDGMTSSITRTLTSNLDLDGSESVLTETNFSIISQESLLRRRLRKHFRTGLPLYRPPTARYKWGEKQSKAHHVWGSLFFDLIYVGVAFQLGHLVHDSLEKDQTIEGIGLFIAIFSTLEMCWQTKMSFDARFNADDLFHRIFQIIQGAVVSFATNSISSLEVMSDAEAPNTLIFSCCILISHLLDFIPYIELYLLSKEANVSATGKFTIYQKVIPTLLAIGSVISAQLAVPLWVTALLWFLIGIYMKCYILTARYFNLFTKDRTVPMHVNWAIHRYLEFLLLMIGESVISIIIVELKTTGNFIATYILCYFLVATLALIVFATGVDEDDRHAMRRSSYRAVGYMVLLSIQSMSLILEGVGFKIILEEAASGSTTTNVTYTWFESASLVVCMLSLFTGRVLHHGLNEEYFALQGHLRVKKTVFWVLKLVLIFIILVAPAMNAPSWGLMLWFWGITALVYLIHLLDLRAFKEHHNEYTKKFVAQRQQQLEKEGIKVDEHTLNQHHGHH